MSQDETTRTPTADDPAMPHDGGVHPMVRKPVAKHDREWAGLAERYGRRWAIYHGDERLEIGKSRAKLYRKYLDRGFRREEIVVLPCSAPIDDVIDDEELHDF